MTNKQPIQGDWVFRYRDVQGRYAKKPVETESKEREDFWQIDWVTALAVIIVFLVLLSVGFWYFG